MQPLKAAHEKDQDELNKELERFENLFLRLESDFQGERSNAASLMKKSLARINQLVGKSPGQDGYFTLRLLLDSADSSEVARELEEAKDLIEKFEENNKNLALAETMLRAEVESLQAEVKMLKILPSPGKDAAKSYKDFLIGAAGLAVIGSILMVGVLEIFPWPHALGISLAAMAIIPLGMGLIGGYFITIGEQLQYRIGLCAKWTIVGLKAMGFGILLLILAVVIAELAGLGDLPGGFILTGGMVLFFVIRARVQGLLLPRSLEWLFS